MAAEATMAAGVVGTAGAVCTAMAGDAVVTAGTAERRWASWSARSDLRTDLVDTLDGDTVSVEVGAALGKLIHALDRDTVCVEVGAALGKLVEPS